MWSLHRLSADWPMPIPLLTKLVLAAVAGSFRFAVTLAAWPAPPVAVTAATVWVVLIR